MAWDSLDEALIRLSSTPPTSAANYFGFYSSWLGGYFREPWAMMLPLDDHGFHRGDAVFEATRLYKRGLIDLEAHLKRLEDSANAIELKLPKPRAEIGRICIELATRANADEGVLRLYVTRGAGGFGPAPSESTGAQIYAAITQIKTPSETAYAQGVNVMVSSVLAKEPRWSRIKSCNYLPNVMMKKEALERGFDYAINVDHTGKVGEGATENLFIVTNSGELLVPRFDYTLRGTTVRQIMALAKDLPSIKEVRFADLTVADIINASEAAFAGTTIGVLPIAKLDGHVIGATRPITQALHKDLQNAWATDAELRTPY